MTTSLLDRFYLSWLTNGRSHTCMAMIPNRKMFELCTAWISTEPCLCQELTLFTTLTRPSIMVMVHSVIGRHYSTLMLWLMQGWTTMRFQQSNHIQLTGTVIQQAWPARQRCWGRSSALSATTGRLRWLMVAILTCLRVVQLTLQILTVRFDVRLFQKWTLVKDSESLELFPTEPSHHG